MVKKSNELLIGIFTCVLLVVLYWGVNFLKGENLFSNKKFFYAVYENVDGLTISRPVTINGFKVGQVANIDFNSNNADLIVEVAIEEDIPFSTNSILEIYDSDIMGSKSLELKFKSGNQMAKSGDTLVGSIASGLTSEVTEQFGSVKIGLDQLIISFDNVLKEIEILSSTANRLLTNNENQLLASVNNIESVSSVIESHTKSIDKIILNFSQITDSLSQIEYVSISNNMLKISKQLESILENVNNAEGTFGKVLHQDSIYNNLNTVINSMDNLLVDIQNNPKKYINLSIWGNDKKNSK
ncbi:MAG: MCE family protein [Flavobacteriales bacterium TMED191]|nr:MAG: MCE family protein [Flavobacteriales bacterium TMED191]